MAKIRFWKWQHTDEFGMPRPTRFRMTDGERKEAEPLDPRSWPVETWKPERSPSDIARATPPK